MKQTFLINSIKRYINMYENIRKNSAAQGNDFIAGCLLDQNYFKGNSR